MSKEASYTMDKRNMEKLSCSVVNVPEVEEKLRKLYLKTGEKQLSKARPRKVSFSDASERNASDAESVGSSYYEEEEACAPEEEVSEGHCRSKHSKGSLSRHSDREVASNDDARSRRFKAKKISEPEQEAVFAPEQLCPSSRHSKSRNNSEPNDYCESQRRSKGSRSRKVSEKSCRSFESSSLNVPSISSEKSSNHSSVYESESPRTQTNNVRGSKSLGNAHREQVQKASPRHMYKSKSNVEHYYRNGKPANLLRRETDANLIRRDERPGTSRTSARSKPSSGGSSETLATQTSRRQRVNSHGDGSEVSSLNHILNGMPVYERTFLNFSLLKETFQTKLDKKELEAFKIWFKCVEYQFMSGKRQIEKKNSIVKKFCKKDDIFKMRLADRNMAVHQGIETVKQHAFVPFMGKFVDFVGSNAYRNLSKHFYK